MKDAKSLPTVVFLDVDYTLIGHSEAACDRYWVARVAKDVEDSHELPKGTCPEPLIDALAEIEPLLRPNLRAGLIGLRQALPNCEIFVCSYGQRAVVEDLKVAGVERATRIRFNRPIFCCTSDRDANVKTSATHVKKKLVRKCFDVAARRLSRKYPLLGDFKTVDKVFQTRFFMVDDTPDIAYDAASNARLVVCPAYKFRPEASNDRFEGMALPRKALQHPLVQDFIREELPMEPLEAVPRDATDDFWLRLADVAKQCGGSVPGIVKCMARDRNH
jgi:hypothetical protein